MSDYPFGVSAIKQLIGTLEDIRRFDLALITSHSEVSFDMMNQNINDLQAVPHVYTSDLCNHLLMWGWTRTREQVKYDADAENLILSEANKLCEEFSDAIPLIDRGSMRYKLARLAASLAIRLFSCSEDYEMVEVHYAHVEYITKFLRDCYNSPTFGYAGFSKAQSLLTTLLDPGSLQASILSTPYPKDFCRSILAQDNIEVQDLADWSESDLQGGQRMLSLFVRKHALVRRGRAYRKSSLFIDLLKSMVDDDNLPDEPKPVAKDKF